MKQEIIDIFLRDPRLADLVLGRLTSRRVWIHLGDDFWLFPYFRTMRGSIVDSCTYVSPRGFGQFPHFLREIFLEMTSEKRLRIQRYVTLSLAAYACLVRLVIFFVKVDLACRGPCSVSWCRLRITEKLDSGLFPYSVFEWCDIVHTSLY